MGGSEGERKGEEMGLGGKERWTEGMDGMGRVGKVNTRAKILATTLLSGRRPIIIFLFS